MAARPMPAVPAIRLNGISKSFGSVAANRDISLEVNAGTIHGIVGENGAGKSTLMSILYGFYRADSGEILVNGRVVSITDSNAAIKAGIGMVHQHFKLVPNFTVLENVILGAEGGPLLGPALKQARQLLQELATGYELNVDPDAITEELSVGLQQRVEILKALYRKADILILDEPTAVLTPAEAEHLFRILKNLRTEGKTIILITHKLGEIMAVTDTVSVMRRGEMTANLSTASTDPAALAELMVGRSVLLRVSKGKATPGPKVLEVNELTVAQGQGSPLLDKVSLHVRQGEILGVAGVSGNGQTQLLEVLGGMIEGQGEIRVNGVGLAAAGAAANARSRRQAGIAHVPEDRQSRGLILEFFAWENFVLGYQGDKRFRLGGLFMDKQAARRVASEKMAQFDIRPPMPDAMARNFSGGNQQKIILAREIDRAPSLLIVGQPTRGVDIGAIEFIHRRLIALRDAGTAILLISVELDEVLSLSDRIAVMFDGRIIGERIADQTDEQEIGLLMAGIAA